MNIENGTYQLPRWEETQFDRKLEETACCLFYLLVNLQESIKNIQNIINKKKKLVKMLPSLKISLA